MVASRLRDQYDWPVGSHIYSTLATGRMERIRISPMPFKRLLARPPSLAIVSRIQAVDIT